MRQRARDGDAVGAAVADGGGATRDGQGATVNCQGDSQGACSRIGVCNRKPVEAQAGVFVGVLRGQGYGVDRCIVDRVDRDGHLVGIAQGAAGAAVATVGGEHGELVAAVVVGLGRVAQAAGGVQQCVDGTRGADQLDAGGAAVVDGHACRGLGDQCAIQNRQGHGDRTRTRVHIGHLQAGQVCGCVFCRCPCGWQGVDRRVVDGCDADGDAVDIGLGTASAGVATVTGGHLKGVVAGVVQRWGVADCAGRGQQGIDRCAGAGELNACGAVVVDGYA